MIKFTLDQIDVVLAISVYSIYVMVSSSQGPPQLYDFFQMALSYIIIYIYIYNYIYSQVGYTFFCHLSVS